MLGCADVAASHSAADPDGCGRVQPVEQRPGATNLALRQRHGGHLARVSRVPATPALAAGDPVLAITGPQVRVVRIIDGDTFYAAPVHGGAQVEVRVLGIDTPETKKPGTPVQCGGPEATAYAKRVLSGQTVTLVNDPSQDRLYRYGRTLAYPCC